MSILLANDFGIWPDATDAHIPGENILKGVDYWGRLIDYLLLYDQIIIPTGDLQIVYILRRILGDDIFIELIRNQVIVLARFNEWYGYSYNNDSGEIYYIVKTTPPDGSSSFLISPHDPLEDLVEKILLLPTNPSTTRDQRDFLKNLLIDNTKVLPINELFNHALKESELDFEKSPYLLNLYSLGGNPFNIKSCAMEDTTTMAMFMAHDLSKVKKQNGSDQKRIYAVLRVMFENFLLCMGNHLHASTLVGDQTSISVLNAKGQRFGLAGVGRDAFTQIKNFNTIPDLGKAFYSREITARTIIELRNSDESINFRDWFSKGSPSENSQDIKDRFQSAFNEKSFNDFPYKILRLGLVTAIGLNGWGYGLVAAGIDQYFLNNWFKNKSPQLFIQKMKVVSNKPTQN